MKFFVLKHVVGAIDETDAEGVDVQTGDAEACPHCGATISSLRWLPPYRVRLACYGKVLADMVQTGGNDWLVSERFMKAWTAQRLQGIEQFESAAVLRVRPKRLASTAQPYFHFRPALARTTRIDWDRSRFVYKREPTCQVCGGKAMEEAICRIRIDESSWSGEDLFRPWRLSGVVITTERVLDLKTKYGLHFHLIPIEEYIRDPDHKCGQAN